MPRRNEIDHEARRSAFVRDCLRTIEDETTRLRTCQPLTDEENDRLARAVREIAMLLRE